VSGLELTALGWAEIGAGFALTAAAIVVLYLVRLLRRMVEVPFVALFREALPDERTTRLFTRLKNVLSLLLVLAIAALVALAAGLPRWARGDRAPRTVVLVLDATASMQAAGPGWLDATAREPVASSEPRFERARRAALARVDALGEGDRALVLLAGPVARVLHPLDDDRGLLASALRTATPTDAPGDAQEALAWAGELCTREGATPGATGSGSAAACAIEVFTDGGLEGLGAAVGALRARGAEVVVHVTTDAEGAEGASASNLAITALSARRFPADPTRAEVIVEVASFAPRPARVEVRISADGALAHREVLELPAGASVQRTLDDLGGADALFEARLAPPAGLDAAGLDAAGLDATGPDATGPDAARLDALAIDDVAYASLAPRRRRRVLVVSPPGGNAYLDAALLLDPYLDVSTTTPERYEAGGAPPDRQVLVFDGYTPAAPPRLPSLLLGPGSTTREWLTVAAPIERPRFEQQARDHALLAFLALRDVNVASARPLVPAPGDEVIASDPRGALLTTGARLAPGAEDAARFVALGFDVRESDLPLRIAWPILVLNALSYLVPDDLAVLEGARTGRPFRLRAAEGAALSLRLRGPGRDGAGHAGELGGAVRDGAVTFELDRAGVYDAVGDETSDDEPRVIVANLFDRAESSLERETLEDARPIDDGAIDAAGSTRPREDEGAWPLHVMLVSAALALLVLEWLTFHRRWTA
jgi:hypothetical protein